MMVKKAKQRKEAAPPELAGANLHCPIRGVLSAPERAADGLMFSEEKRRIDAIRFLLQRGYPRANFEIETVLLRFGHEGRNSFRCDFCIYDQPAANLANADLATRIAHMKLVAEIKRDNAKAAEAKRTQVYPALGFLTDLSALGVYWDDLEQRFFYRTVKGNHTQVDDAPIARIPIWGQPVTSTELMHGDLTPSKELPKIFDQLDDLLYTHVADKAKRYSVILQLLLLKIHDENRHRVKPKASLDLQDFSTSPLGDKAVEKKLNDALKSAVDHYQRFLPKKIATTFRIPVEALRRASALLAPVNLLESRKEVLQAFYMKFAKNLYKWDLAQYFTPHEVIDFIVNVINPQYGEHVKDPACGSADFLIAAFRVLQKLDANAGQCIWGSDNSEQAVQISILNMVLNGDGKTNIKEEDSLRDFDNHGRSYDIILCNPPFGTKIVETRADVLSKFEMGYKWTVDDDGSNLQKHEQLRPSQQSGILFAELCVRLARPGGRIGIILPNGYLGNVGVTYVALREWLLRHTRLAGIVGFPRFTFNKSGADVSASVVFLERRETPLADASDSEDYRFFVAMTESVGWRVGNKKSAPLYNQDEQTGALILDKNNDPVLDTDFPSIYEEFLRSPAAQYFQWLVADKTIPEGPQGWSWDIASVSQSPVRMLDPKRLCRKFADLRTAITRKRHFKLGKVIERVGTRPFRPVIADLYRYVEIENIGAGDYDYEEMRGWQLPGRAKLSAQEGDIFIAGIWGCAGKWFIAGDDCDNVVVTNGCRLFRLKNGAHADLPDLIAGLCSEAFRIQMRALSTGSDGLADVAEDDILDVVLPRVVDDEMRHRIDAWLDTIRRGEVRLSKAMAQFLANANGWREPAPRKRHWMLV